MRAQTLGNTRALFRRWLLSALAFAGLLVGCGEGEPSLIMMPTPILLKDARLDFTRLVAPQHRDTDVRVFYATTRAPAPSEDPQHYLRDAGDAVRLGLAQVHLGEPDWSFEDLATSDRESDIDALRPARIARVEEFGTLGGDAERAFIAGINEEVRTSPTGEAVIYVPGYRVTFNQVMALLGSWAHFLGRSSSVIAFSWPTGTRVWSYLVHRRREGVTHLAGPRRPSPRHASSEYSRYSCVGVPCEGRR